MKISFLATFFFSITILSQGIFAQSPVIEKGYFQYPFNPGHPQTLSGSMGELRTNHFHGGIDVRTSGTIGLPILAAADGYVSKIIVTSYSYGNTIQITHPNGYITVYAHLDKFYKKIGDYTRTMQYGKEAFDVELLPNKNELQVKKGDTIGLSGNTGASRGPHLHFEIRDAQNKMYNPLLWGFPEIKDNVAPIFENIALRTFDKNARINDEFGRSEFKPLLKNGVYRLSGPIDIWGTVGIEIQTHDKMNLAAFRMGISYITVKLDGKEIFEHDVTVYGFEENRYINIKLDYETLMKRGVRFERCYIADGDKLSTYKRNTNRGKINISDQRNHEVEITIGDVMGNKSLMALTLRGKKPSFEPLVWIKNAPAVNKIDLELFENILKITSPIKPDMSCKLYVKGKIQSLFPEYFKNGLAVFLYDMRRGIADSVEIDGKSKKTNYISMIPSGKPYTYVLPGMKVVFTADALFDTLYTVFNHGLDPQKREIFQLNDHTVPMFTQPTITLTPMLPVPNKPFSGGYNANRWPQYEGGTWTGSSVTFKSKTLGKFTVLKDTIPPIITEKPKLKNTVYFQIGDGQSGVGSFRATLDGEWVLMNFDHKRRLIWSELKDSEQQFQGNFVLEIKDKAGNAKTFTKKY